MNRKSSPEMIEQGFKILKAIIERKFTNEQVDEWAKVAKQNEVCCRYCSDSGLVHAKLKSNFKYTYAFKCGCIIGKEKDVAYPVWGSSFFNNYEIMY